MIHKSSFLCATVPLFLISSTTHRSLQTLKQPRTPDSLNGTINHQSVEVLVQHLSYTVIHMRSGKSLFDLSGSNCFSVKTSKQKNCERKVNLKCIVRSLQQYGNISSNTILHADAWHSMTRSLNGPYTINVIGFNFVTRNNKMIEFRSTVQ